MCGIAGGIYPRNREIDINRMLDIIHHRGPNGEGKFSTLTLNNAVVIGNRRLSIIDIVGSDQPIFNEDRSIAVVFNGEIYNYKDLREQLLSKGHTLYTTGDTECIVHLYEEYGENFVQHLRGMYAIALLDIKRRKLILVRDAVGIKPLYYYLAPDSSMLLFGSELKSIEPYIPKDLSPDAVVKYFTYRYIPGDKAIYQDTYKLEAGTMLSINYETMVHQKTKFWELEPNSGAYTGPYIQAKEELTNLLRESVKLRLQSEVPVGVFLSGGVDSSIIATLANSLSNSQVSTYSIGFAEENACEFEFVNTLVRQKGITNYQRILPKDHIALTATKVIKSMDEPIADAAQIPLYYLSKWASNSSTVMLSGEGADEIFAGYWQYTNTFSKHSGITDASLRYFLDQSSYFLDSSDSLFQKSQLLNNDNPLAIAQKYFKKSVLEGMLNVDFHTWLPENLLMKVDKVTMLHSLETRVPFLDTKVVNFVNALPMQWKYGSTTKLILKDIARDLGIPDSLLVRPKMGFTVPIYNLLKTSFNASMNDLVRSSTIRNLSILNIEGVSRLISNLTPHNYLRVWTLFIFLSWYYHSRNR